MVGKDLTYTVGVDASDAVSGLRKLESAVRSTMRDVEGELDESASAGDKFAASIDRLSAQMKEDFNSSAIAAEELQRALKDAGSTMDVGDALTELNRMGISMDEVTADADKFAQSLKQLDDVRVTGVKELDSVAPGLATKLDNVQKSADSSKGALANMIGNSAQDLGELGGIAGSAGVAVGQMAEYFADAAFEGEGFGSVLKNFAAVAGPIAALSAGVAILSAGIAAYNKPAEDAAKRTEELGEAMDEGGDDALAFADVLRENASALSDFIASSNDPTGDFGVWIDEMASKIPVVGGYFKEAGVNIFDAARKAGLSVYALGKQIDGTGESSRAFHDRLQAAADAGKITGDEMRALEEAMRKYGDSAAKAAKDSGILGVSTDEVNAIIAEGADPLTRYTDKWNVLFEDLADGKADTQATTDAINFLADALGMTEPEVVALAQEHLNEELEASVQAAEDAAEAQREAAQAAKEHAIAVAAAEEALYSLTTQAAVWSQRGGVISGLLGDAAGMSEAKANVRDIAIAIGEIPEELAKVNVGDVLANATSADALLDKLDSIGSQVRERVADAFATGGPEAANQMAADYVAQVTAALGGKFTSEQVAEMLGLGDVKATIDLAVAQDAIARVKATIDAVTGVSGTSPFTATIGLAVEAGTLSASAGQVIANWQAQEAGIDVPFEPVTDPAAVAEANAFMAAYAAAHPPVVPLEGDPSGVLDTAGKAVDTVEGNTATVPLDADPAKADKEAQAVKTKAEALKPVVNIDSDTKTAIATMVLLKVLAQLLAPTVYVSADASSAVTTLGAIGRMRPQVPVEAYLADYPTSAEIVARIGRPRVPVDIVVGSSIRITGVRE
jgi:hypothetical protein